MHRFTSAVAIALATAISLGGCASMGGMNPSAFADTSPYEGKVAFPPNTRLHGALHGIERYVDDSIRVAMGKVLERARSGKPEAFNMKENGRLVRVVMEVTNTTVTDMPCRNFVVRFTNKKGEALVGGFHGYHELDGTACRKSAGTWVMQSA